MQISRPETSWKRDSGTDIFLWIFHNFSKNLIYRTPVANCSCWFLHSNQSFIHWSHFVHFFFHFFSFIIDNCNYGSVLRKCLKMKNFLLFTIVFTFYVNVVHTILPLLMHIKENTVMSNEWWSCFFSCR